MSMRLHSIGAYIVAAALLLILFFSVRSGQNNGYAVDESYVRDAVAESVGSYNMYGIAGIPKPATQDSWWRWAGGKVLALSGSGAGSTYQLLSIIFSLALLFFLIKVLSLQYPQYEIVGWIAGLLLVLSPPLILWNVNGVSGPLASLLMLLAVVIHMSSSSEGRPLPLSSAVCIGMATTLRLEFVAVWLALIMHALILSSTKRKHVSFVAVLLNGVNGLLLVAIFIAPLLNWNMRVIEVPWPRSFDSAMALDALAGDVTAAASSFGSILTAGISSAYQQWASVGIAGGWSVKLFSIIGLVYWIGRSRGGSRDNYINIAVVLLLTPVFHALLKPFVGPSGGVALYQAMLPIWILATVAGIAALQHALDPIFSKLVPAFSSHMRHMIVFGLFAVTPILSGALNNLTAVENEKIAVERNDASFARVVESFEESGIAEAAILTDQPGRLLANWRGRVYDLRAELNPELLYYFDQTPSEDLADIVEHAKEQGSESVGLIIWNRDFWINTGVAPCADLNEDADDGQAPFACIL